jgi:DNA-binding response OmpR family regulator
LLRALAELRDRLPLLVLTSRGQVDERVQALELGADCLGEPFAMREVAARVRALLRRARPQEEAHRLVHGPLVVDTDAHRAYLAGEPLALLPREWAVLQVLLNHAERVVSKETISRSIAGVGKPMSANTIETYISRLRAKLERAGMRIRTVHRVGYMLEAEAPAIRTERAASYG